MLSQRKMVLLQEYSMYFCENDKEGNKTLLNFNHHILYTPTCPSIPVNMVKRMPIIMLKKSLYRCTVMSIDMFNSILLWCFYILFPLFWSACYARGHYCIWLWHWSKEEVTSCSIRKKQKQKQKQNSTLYHYSWKIHMPIRTNDHIPNFLLYFKM